MKIELTQEELEYAVGEYAVGKLAWYEGTKTFKIIMYAENKRFWCTVEEVQEEVPKGKKK